jgi:hypothetical protein
MFDLRVGAGFHHQGRLSGPSREAYSLPVDALSRPAPPARAGPLLALL